VLPIVVDRRGADQIRVKGPFDFVTDTDVQVERVLERVLGERLPDIQFVGEEGGQVPPEDGRFWLVDPVCGTENYVVGLPLYSINVALVENGQVTTAVVADGASGDIYLAERDRGAFMLRGDQHIRLHANPSSRLLNVDPSPVQQPNFGTNLAIRALASGQWNVRVLSTSLGLPYLAAGRIAAAVYTSTGVPVHFAAGLLLAEEAGARVTDARGDRWDLRSTVYVVAASDTLHDELLGLVQGTPTTSVQITWA
jgi:myo-inositol-1(or 4)-monophosphatase